MSALYTGAIGSGKTYRAVELLHDLHKSSPERLILVHGIRGLNNDKIPYRQIYCHSANCEFCNSVSVTVPPYLFTSDGSLHNEKEVDEAQKKLQGMLFVEDLHVWGDKSEFCGCIIVLDEAQRFWGSRNIGQPPPAVVWLQTHRQKGIEIILITQSTSLIDTRIKPCLNQHIHHKPSFRGNFAYEWSEVCDTPTSRSSQSSAVKHKFQLKQQIYDLYVSSSLNVVVNRKKPLSIYFLIPLVIFLAYLLLDGVSGFLGFGDKPAPSPSPSPSTQQPSPSTLGSSISNVTQPNSNSFLSSSAATFDAAVFDYNPREPNRPETAPAYDGMVKAVDYPKIDHCENYSVPFLPDNVDFNFEFDIKKPKYPTGTEFKDVCTCYTQQHTVYQTTTDYCKGHAQGKVFNPYKSVQTSTTFQANNYFPEIAGLKLVSIQSQYLDSGEVTFFYDDKDGNLAKIDSQFFTNNGVIVKINGFCSVSLILNDNSMYTLTCKSPLIKQCTGRAGDENYFKFYDCEKVGTPSRQPMQQQLPLIDAALQQPQSQQPRQM